MSVIINGDTGIDKITDGSVVQADLASGITVDSLSTASGSAPSYSARAWVNFNGTGAVAIRASGNVSSITDVSTGIYVVNLTTAMSDANYCITTNTTQNFGTTASIADICFTGAQASSNFYIFSYNDNTATDFQGIYAAVFG